jgi:hypothetical protein
VHVYKAQSTLISLYGPQPVDSNLTKFQTYPKYPSILATNHPWLIIPSFQPFWKSLSLEIKSK